MCPESLNEDCGDLVQPSEQSESPSAVGIPLSNLPHYECGAILFSRPAFPEPDADSDLARLHASLCHLALRAIADGDEQWRWSPQLIKPGYALLSESEVRTASRTVDRRLRDRLQAAIVAKPFLEQATTGQPPTLPSGVEKLSLNSMAKYLLFRGKSDHDYGDVRNLHARVWRPSLPVIRLAVALNVLFERTKPAGPDKLGIHDLIRSREAIEFLVETAQSLEGLVTQIPALGISEVFTSAVPADELEIQKKALLAQIQAAPNANSVVQLHPNAAVLYAEKVAQLQEALGRPRDRPEAIDALRLLIDRIVLPPDAEAPDGHIIELHGDIATILNLAATPLKRKRCSAAL